MKNLDDARGPGFDELLRQSLQAWGIEELTDVQGRALEAGAASGESLVVCAPTSSGKTLIGEIAIHQALRRGKRCLYLVSHKALAAQKYSDFVNRFSGDTSDPSATIGLSTGDGDEGDIRSDVLVSTYEKGLVLVLAGQIDPEDSVVVADELQIIGDPNRGPSIELLCAFLRHRRVDQFLALTATVENPGDLSSWLRCNLVQSHIRDVDLRQEIWYQNRCYGVTFGHEEGQVDETGEVYPNNTLDAVARLIEKERGPILVFTETRREATELARSFGRRRQKRASGIDIAEQLELFSEPTDGSASLQNSAERRVAFHTADLSPQERDVIENAFLRNEFDVCFATSTLAAGVNFPFRTVVFPKLTYQYGERRGTRILRADYRNMSGRAGRLGMHDLGYAVLLPKNPSENNHANRIVLPENDRIQSRLASLTMRRAVLTLIASGGAQSFGALREYFENTYFWFQLLERNPEKLDAVLASSQEALKWLVQYGFVDQDEERYIVTPLGYATAWSGLLPSTARAFAELLQERVDDFGDRFQQLIGGIIHWVCCSSEFSGETRTRFLPYPIGGVAPGSPTFVAGRQLLRTLDRTDTQLCQSVHALILFVEGTEDRIISRRTNMTSGSVHRLAADVAWVLDGLRTIAAVPDLSCPQAVGNSLGMLARRVRWGSTTETLDIIRIAERARVPGFGRQRAMALSGSGVTTFEEIENLGVDSLTQIVGNRQRATALLEAIGQEIDGTPNRFSTVHRRLAKQLSIEDIVVDCSTLMEKDYEDAIVRLLKTEETWQISVRDDGIRLNEPDVLIRLDDVAILLEVKTAPKKTGLIKKEQAFAVLQKGADYGHELFRVTLGKPHFDEMSKSKVIASTELTLVEHVSFLEGMLRVLTREISPHDFLAWLAEPGEAELARLPGKATYLLV